EIISRRICSPNRALVNPGTQQSNLRGGELVSLSGRRHLHIFDQPGDIMDERTAGAASWQDIGAVFAAFERIRTIVEPEAALRSLRPVAPEAEGFQDGLDVQGEIHLSGGWRRQFGRVHFITDDS